MMSRDDRREDASSLVQTLTVQLLRSETSSFDLNLITKDELEKIRNNDLDTLCVLFRHLVQQLPNGSFTFMVIDSIILYERSERRRDFVRVAKEILEAVEKSNSVLKVLFTCQGKSSYVKDFFEKDDVFTVPPFIDGGRQGWSEHAFQRTLSHEIEDLNLEGR